MDIKSKNELRMEEERRRMEEAKKAKSAPLASKAKTYTRPATDAVRTNLPFLKNSTQNNKRD